MNFFVALLLLAALASASDFSSFAYSVADLHTGDFKNQIDTKTGHNVQGQYSLLESDGTRRTVDYAAGAEGFKAVVRKDPALISLVFDPVLPVGPIVPSHPIFPDELIRKEPDFRILPIGPIAPKEPIFRILPIGPIAPKEPTFRILPVGPITPKETSFHILPIGPIPKPH